MYKEGDQSAFNFAVEYLKQISETLRMCNLAQSMQDLNGWMNYLQVLHTQLSAKTTETEDEEIFSKFKSISEKVNDSDKKYDERGQILYELRLLQMHIVKKLQAKGMLLPGKSDPRFAVLER